MKKFQKNSLFSPFKFFVFSAFFWIFSHSVVYGVSSLRDKVQYALDNMTPNEFREYQIMTLPDQVKVLEKKLSLKPGVSKKILIALVYEVIQSVSSVPLE